MASLAKRGIENWRLSIETEEYILAENRFSPVGIAWSTSGALKTPNVFFVTNSRAILTGTVTSVAYGSCCAARQSMMSNPHWLWPDRKRAPTAKSSTDSEMSAGHCNDLAEKCHDQRSHGLVPRRGFEPLTCPLGGGHSIQLSYRGDGAGKARHYTNAGGAGTWRRPVKPSAADDPWRH